MAPRLPHALTGLAIACAVASAGTARAQADDAGRVRFLEEHLSAGEGAATTWWVGWMVAYGALTVGQTTIGLLAGELTSSAEDAHQLRVNMFVGAAGSLVGVIALSITPLTAMSAGESLRATAGAPPTERRARGEALLDDAADEEDFGTSWLAHVGAFVVNATLGLVLWLGYDLPVDAAINFAAGMAIAEAQILTQPTRAIGDRETYRGLTVSPFPGGAAATVIF